MNFNHLSLFSGIGGFDLASEWMGWNNVAHCEINEFCLKILKYYWPNAKTHTDIKTTDFNVYRGLINILTGGFPCQGFSIAGLRAGTDDDRYLWPEYLRAIDEIQPGWVIGENVTGILSMEDKSGIYRDVFAKVENRKVTRLYPVDEYEAIYTRQAKMLVNSICESLEERGYEVQTFAIPAASVEAPHIRERIWFVAYRANTGVKGLRSERENTFYELGNATDTSGIRSRKSVVRKQSEQFDPNGEERGVIANASNKGLQTTQQEKLPGTFRFNKGGTVEQFPASQSTSRRVFDDFPTQSPVCNGDDGLSTRLDGITFSKWRNESIKGGGNAVAPQIPFEIFKAIEAYEISI